MKAVIVIFAIYCTLALGSMPATNEEEELRIAQCIKDRGYANNEDCKWACVMHGEYVFDDRTINPEALKRNASDPILRGLNKYSDDCVTKPHFCDFARCILRDLY